MMAARRKAVTPVEAKPEGIVWTRVKIQPIGGDKYVLTALFTEDGGPEHEAESTGVADVSRDAVEKVARNILAGAREKERVKADAWYVE